MMTRPGAKNALPKRPCHESQKALESAWSFKTSTLLLYGEQD
ncbi:hypothetical protein X474_23715 [Dethiosulfatarculus sandiegensis]|uniref:Uncharacterized protein n=1 Tax=Dethiosulfatarculus sandiegensis TaxID=1429043 RepID=A0A0D2G9L6_9BACT|nr:hypothetical protein X474_23715 [Dethiosulfatarculus sandiegensis]